MGSGLRVEVSSGLALALSVRVRASAQCLSYCLGLALPIRSELRSGYVRVNAVLGQGKQSRLRKSSAQIDA